MFNRNGLKAAFVAWVHSLSYFNLDEKYSELRFVFGIVEDSSDKNAEVAIYTDGELAEHFSAKMGDLPHRT